MTIKEPDNRRITFYIKYEWALAKQAGKGGNIELSYFSGMKND